MQTLPKVLESLTKARFQDCDPFGHLNNARYIEYFMDARQDQIAEHYGISVLEPGREDSWVVTLSQIAFLRPVGVLEPIRVRTHLIAADRRGLTVEGAMFAQDLSRVKALAWVEFAYVNTRTGRRSKHPDDLLELLESVRVDGAYQADGFVRRAADVAAIKRDLG